MATQVAAAISRVYVFIVLFLVRMGDLNQSPLKTAVRRRFVQQIVDFRRNALGPPGGAIQ